MNRIFISIAAFVDPLLFFTVCRALHQAKYPGRLRFGIVEQGVFNNDWLFSQHSQISYRFFHASESEGVCWARHEVQKLYQDEELYLQIDSHTEFAQDWDVTLEHSLNQLSENYALPVITTYPPGFTIEPDGKVKCAPLNNNYALGLVPAKGAQITPDDPVFLYQGVWVQTEHPPLGFHVAGGFIFASGQWVKDVPYDPNLYFHGEEQNLAIRAFTHGWNIFHPKDIPLWHLYKAMGNSYLNHHWHPEWEAKRTLKWTDRQQRAKQRLKQVLYGEIPVGHIYGLGRLRDLNIYRDFTGIDYENCTINRSKHAWLGMPG
ncbi:MAG: GlcNAc-transferase family protein [Limnobacter sp.]|nr:GlcNAc-transferase family protein [Limnobacter sp.]